ncbi:putative F-box/FBD/LRR-repeat protein At1g78760 [Mercurialis annua]|uniref:putative F-box/FBD/LRR-repeat protein At1g78760 n=1 Tax=Mercurialis annua TaxID=3986 RepID=UPI00215FD120|nr:putative F-box/FBD/LRR-repeat protein At1g78760 [Mercurialis annua]
MSSESKRQIYLENAYEDRISKLPEAIHCQILSYLSTKDAAKTSVLSRSWRHAWTSLADLDLHSPRDVNRKSFVDFVNRALTVRSFPIIKRFRLNIQGDCSSSNVKSWIEAAVSYKVEELDLCIGQGGVDLLGRLFSCESLRVLKFEGRGGFIIRNSYFPGTMSMPNLKILRLDTIEYSSDFTIERMLSCFVNLEELIFYRLIDHTVKDKTIHVQSSSLKVLKIHMLSGCYMKKTRVVVDAPKLEFLELYSFGCLILDIEANSCSIVDAVLYLKSYIWSYPKEAAIQSAVARFVASISSTVKVLALSPDILQDLFDASNNNMPCFPNLNQLVVKYFQSGMSNLLDMLRILPNLKVLVLTKVYENFVLSKSWDDEQNVVPQCLKSSIERIEFKGYTGFSGDMEILKYILRNAKALKKFYISAFSSQDSQEPFKEELLNKVLVLPKTCQVKIEHSMGIPYQFHAAK